MQFLSGVPEINNKTCPLAWNWFFYGCYRPEILCMQDNVHLVVKLHRTLMNKQITFGKMIASRGDLLALLENKSKAEHGLTKTFLALGGDTMSYRTADSVSSVRVQNCLTLETAAATKFYLELVQMIIRAYINSDTPVSERIYNAWFVIFVFRFVKESLLHACYQG